ncbi:hypothetical protein EDC40_101277 [Aminobacter aminovorans]|uniref:Uncharacterized protein n=1 Tax=Aminobacter aminovorans TaxID=83263 RepID=A0A380WPP6_AMIAI|nr:hypothetical protein [Aminobacter aminovorans]TCS29962.1 hypothetical protein EDC40_101277 [Aminobacter aminovorans]SUU90811.1 Uncharacterised protein [Aminobacter aminovorans]
MNVTYDSAAGTFTMANGAWTNTYPISDLPQWLAFYRNQQELFPRYAASYQGSVDGLEKLAAELRSDMM